MSRLRFTKVATPSSPAANKAEIFYSSTLSPIGMAAIDESGNILRIGGFATKDYRLVTVVKILNGTTSYTPTSGVSALFVEIIGGGGGGGPCAAGIANTSSSPAGGGGGGEYANKWITTLVSGVHNSIAVGAGGTATGAGAGTGGAGNTTTFTDNAASTVFTAVGGSGGVGAAVQTTLGAGNGAGGAGGTGGTGALVAVQGEDGDYGAVVNLTASATGSWSGRGGNSVYGSGGQKKIVSGVGNAGRLYGGGGGGSLECAGGGARAGTVGGNGIIIVHEFA